MTHKLTNFRELRSGRTVAYCSACGKEVGVLDGKTMSGKPKKVCEASARLQTRQKRQTDRKRESRAKKTGLRKREQYAAKLWRYIAYHRSGFKCEVCGVQMEPGVNGLQAHHLVNRSQSKRLQLDPANSQALCFKCHCRAGRDSIWALSYAELREPGISAYLLAERRIMGAIPLEDAIAKLEQIAGMYGVELGERKGGTDGL